jgi:glycosyltransferase involved in cell wall biosynthesis
MRVLMLTNMYPDPEHRRLGVYVKREVEALKGLGVDVDVMVVEGWRRRSEYFRAYPRLRRILRENRYHLIHAYYGLSGLIACAQSRVPFVVTFCGDDALGARKRNGGVTAFSRILVKAAKSAASRAAAVTVKTRQMKDVFPPGAKVTVIPSGVDLRMFRPMDRESCCRELGLAEAPLKILFLGDTSLPVKDFPLAREAVDVLRQRGMDATLMAVSKVTDEEIVLHMNACDCLLITSMSEGSPNVAVESLACNLPIVSVEVGDVMELIDGVEGCRLTSRDPESIADALEDVLTKRERISGTDRVAHLDISRIALRILEVYRGVVAKAGRC